MQLIFTQLKMDSISESLHQHQMGAKVIQKKEIDILELFGKARKVLEVNLGVSFGK